MKNLDQLDQASLHAQVETLHHQLAAGTEHVGWHPAKRGADGVIALGWPKYPDWLGDGIWSAIHFLERTDEFNRDLGRATYREILDRHREVSEAQSAEEVWAGFVSYGSGERFCDGRIASGVDDGTIAALVTQFLRLFPSVSR